jgi:flavin reductase (DIM6/NTAB) family NADH-FMN oxidoreductase RutF
MGTELVQSEGFREALAHFASGVTVVAAHSAGTLVGFTATGFTSVSLDPALILVCIGKRASAHDGIVGASQFGVSILSERQASIAQQFARSGIDRFLGVPLLRADVPLVDGAIAKLRCRLHALHDAGDHTIVVGEVLETSTGPGRPLVHFQRQFGGFVGAPPVRPIAPMSESQRGEPA